MKKTTLFLGLGALLLSFGIISASAGTALAYRGDLAVKSPNCSLERHEAMKKAFETNNYDAWKNLMKGKGRVMQVINKDNFAKFAQAHTLAQQGKIVEAQKIRQELGLGLHNGSGKTLGGMGRGINR